MRIHPDPDGEHRRRRTLSVRRRRRRRALPVLGLLVLTLAPAALPRVLVPPTSAFMLAARVQAAREGRTLTIEHRPVALSELSPQLALAVIAAEDQRFPFHRGIDFTEIRRALDDASGAPTRGASTLSQQLVKNLYLWSGRSWMRKGIEAWLAVWLEVFCSKQRILTLYLNFAEFGTGVYGAEAASRRFFGKPARALSAPEAALLAAVLPRPRGALDRGPTATLRARQAWILRQMQQLGGTGYLDRLR
ncbi:MAG: monofunctional biosynthetic peptidoglycan transglycosylase [Gammaproteobacteria bacterium]